MTPCPPSAWVRRHVLEPAGETFRRWLRDNAPQWSAAIAFYTLFSLAPVLIVSTAVAGRFWSNQRVRAELMVRFEELLGERGAEQIGSLVERSLPVRSGLAATLAGVVLLLFGASVALDTVRRALNAVWGVEDATPRGIRGFVRGRLLSLGLLLVLAVLLLASLAASAAIAAWGAAIEEWLPLPLPLVRLADLALSVLLLGVLFAMVFKWLPSAVIAWRDVWVGAAITAVLFVAGKAALGAYLGSAAIASAYGAAGSIVLLLLWVYYSAMIFLFGAEATRVWARRAGSRIRPSGGNAEGGG